MHSNAQLVSFAALLIAAVVALTSAPPLIRASASIVMLCAASIFAIWLMRQRGKRTQLTAFVILGLSFVVIVFSFADIYAKTWFGPNVTRVQYLEALHGSILIWVGLELPGQETLGAIVVIQALLGYGFMAILISAVVGHFAPDAGRQDLEVHLRQDLDLDGKVTARDFKTCTFEYQVENVRRDVVVGWSPCTVTVHDRDCFATVPDVTMTEFVTIRVTTERGRIWESDALTSSRRHVMLEQIGETGPV